MKTKAWNTNQVRVKSKVWSKNKKKKDSKVETKKSNKVWAKQWRKELYKRDKNGSMNDWKINVTSN